VLLVLTLFRSGVPVSTDGELAHFFLVLSSAFFCSVTTKKDPSPPVPRDAPVEGAIRAESMPDRGVEWRNQGWGPCSNSLPLSPLSLGTWDP
jgi:hypothetical protein